MAGRTNGHVCRLPRHTYVHEVSANRANDEAGLTSVVWAMRAVREGSYSIDSTTALMPSLLRLKSMKR